MKIKVKKKTTKNPQNQKVMIRKKVPYNEYEVVKISSYLQKLSLSGKPREYEVKVDDLKVIPRTKDFNKVRNINSYLLEESEKVSIILFKGKSRNYDRFDLLLKQENELLTDEQVDSLVQKEMNKYIKERTTQIKINELQKDKRKLQKDKDQLKSKNKRLLKENDKLLEKLLDKENNPPLKINEIIGSVKALSSTQRGEILPDIPKELFDLVLDIKKRKGNEFLFELSLIADTLSKDDTLYENVKTFIINQSSNSTNHEK